MRSEELKELAIVNEQLAIGASAAHRGALAAEASKSPFSQSATSVLRVRGHPVRQSLSAPLTI